MPFSSPVVVHTIVIKAITPTSKNTTHGASGVPKRYEKLTPNERPLCPSEVDIPAMAPNTQTKLINFPRLPFALSRPQGIRILLIKPLSFLRYIKYPTARPTTENADHA